MRSQELGLAFHDDEPRNFRPPTEWEKMLKACTGECDSLRTERTADDLLNMTHYCGEVFIRSDGKRLGCNLAGLPSFWRWFYSVFLCDQKSGGFRYLKERPN